jgi:hypothetical protein
MNKPPVVMGSYRELQIVNGQVVKNVELVEALRKVICPGERCRRLECKNKG